MDHGGEVFFTLGSDVLLVIATSLEVEALAALEGDLAGGIFGLVTDETLSTFDDVGWRRHCLLWAPTSSIVAPLNSQT